MKPQILFDRKVFIDIYRYIIDYMTRKVEIMKNTLVLKDKSIEGFLERIVTPFGTSGKADVPRKYIGQRVYVIVTKSRVSQKED